MDGLRQRIADFLSGSVFAVAGASNDRSKFGNQVLRHYLAHGKRVIPVNPRATEVEGLPCVPDLRSLPEPVHGLSIITPPAITEGLVDEAIAVGIPRLWMQPGAESRPAIQRAKAAGLTVIGYGPCVLVEL
jgi:predicted CoA-binding protein